MRRCGLTRALPTRQAQEEDAQLARTNIKARSSHDVLDDARLSSEQAVDTAALASKLKKRKEEAADAEAMRARGKAGGGGADGEGDFDARMVAVVDTEGEAW